MFTGGADGGHPQGGLVQGADGNFHGTTSLGGAHADAAVFEVTAAGAETVLYSFSGAPTDGNDPTAGLLLASDGSFYGTTSKGGAVDSGIVFKMTSTGTVTILHSFAGGAPDGAGLRPT